MKGDYRRRSQRAKTKGAGSLNRLIKGVVRGAKATIKKPNSYEFTQKLENFYFIL